MKFFRRIAYQGRGFSAVLLSLGLLSGLVGCEAPATSGGEASRATGATGAVQGRDEVNQPSVPLPVDPTELASEEGGPAESPPGPAPAPTPPPSGAVPAPSTAAIGPTCHSTDPNRICLSLRYVVYQGSSGTSILSEAETLTNLTAINQLWASCNVAFEIGELLTVNPADFGLNYNTPTSGELSSIRDTFEQENTLLVVSTGAWSGSLGAGAANAWTSMPESAPYGVVLEASVANYPNLIAHELGHYLNLDHASDSSNMMSPVIYDSSRSLTASQCTTARTAAKYYWDKMMR